MYATEGQQTKLVLPSMLDFGVSHLLVVSKYMWWFHEELLLT